MKFELVHAGHNYYVIEVREGGVLAACVFITPKSQTGADVNAQVALMPDGPLWGTDAKTMSMLTGEALACLLNADGVTENAKLAKRLIDTPASSNEFVSLAMRIAHRLSRVV